MYKNSIFLFIYITFEIISTPHYYAVLESLKKMTADFDFVSGLRAHDVKFFVIIVTQ